MFDLFRIQVILHVIGQVVDAAPYEYLATPEGEEICAAYVVLAAGFEGHRGAW